MFSLPIKVFMAIAATVFLKYLTRNPLIRFLDVLKKIPLNELITTEEIRLRANKPLMIQNEKGSFFVIWKEDLQQTG